MISEKDFDILCKTVVANLSPYRVWRSWEVRGFVKDYLTRYFYKNFDIKGNINIEVEKVGQGKIKIDFEMIDMFGKITKFSSVACRVNRRSANNIIMDSVLMSLRGGGR